MSSQPSINDGLNTQGNPTSKEPAEQKEANAKASSDEGQAEQRKPQDQPTSSDDATATASGQGIRGGGAGEKESDLSDQAKGRSHVEEDDNLGDPGEGRVADAVKSKY